MTSRRAFLTTLAAAICVPRASLAAPSPGTRLILLGTAGGPSPKRTRAAPAQVIVTGDRACVIDCGNGVARQLALAGVSLRTIRHVFLTHQHSDHNADVGSLLLLAWATGLSAPVDAWGPPPLERMWRLFLEMNATDIDTRIADEGLPPLAPLVRTHELTLGGRVLQDDVMTVTSALVNHPPLTAFAYRFDAADRSIVISGDTSRSDSLIRLARGADVLVHEVMYLPAVAEIVKANPGSTRLREHLLASHTPVEEAGAVASAAGVKTLVLSHFVPGETPSVPDEVWRAAAQKHFSGEVIVGKDLMEI